QVYSIYGGFEKYEILALFGCLLRPFCMGLRSIMGKFNNISKLSYPNISNNNLFYFLLTKNQVFLDFVF
ncbi:MAG: hypothetical protein ACK56F_26230, partial [bacterium]